MQRKDLQHFLDTFAHAITAVRWSPARPAEQVEWPKALWNTPLAGGSGSRRDRAY